MDESKPEKKKKVAKPKDNIAKEETNVVKEGSNEQVTVTEKAPEGTASTTNGPAHDDVASTTTAPVRHLYYKNKPILQISQKLINGRLYKQIITAESVHALTEEEFATEVTDKMVVTK